MSERVCGCERDAKVAASYACERERGTARLRCARTCTSYHQRLD